MPDFASQPTTLDEQIASVRENIRELVERAAAYSSAADDDLATRRIADQEDRFELLTKRPTSFPGVLYNQNTRPVK
jgi:hypothetical protein